MPAFGKSGTCLMCCLRSIVTCWSGESRTLRLPHLLFRHRKRRVLARRVLVVHIHAVDSGAARSGAKRPFEAGHRLGIPFSEDLNPPVRQVAHPACDAFATCRVLREVAESDALHAPAHHKPTCHAHGFLNFELYSSLRWIPPSSPVLPARTLTRRAHHISPRRFAPAICCANGSASSDSSHAAVWASCTKPRT